MSAKQGETGKFDQSEELSNQMSSVKP